MRSSLFPLNTIVKQPRSAVVTHSHQTQSLLAAPLALSLYDRM
jgi:hypothetical protein